MGVLPIPATDKKELKDLDMMAPKETMEDMAIRKNRAEDLRD